MPLGWARAECMSHKNQQQKSSITLDKEEKKKAKEIKCTAQVGGNKKPNSKHKSNEHTEFSILQTVWQSLLSSVVGEIQKSPTSDCGSWSQWFHIISRLKTRSV